MDFQKDTQDRTPTPENRVGAGAVNRAHNRKKKLSDELLSPAHALLILRLRCGTLRIVTRPEFFQRRQWLENIIHTPNYRLQGVPL